MARPSSPVRRGRPPVKLEKHEQADCVQLLRSLGAAVYVLGTVRPRGDTPGTRQSPGIADVEAFLPRPRYPAMCGQVGAVGQWDPRRMLKLEVKRSRGGKLRPEQIEYRQHCIDAGVAHVVGDLNALMAWLVAEGYLLASQLPHDRQPELEP